MFQSIDLGMNRTRMNIRPVRFPPLLIKGLNFGQKVFDVLLGSGLADDYFQKSVIHSRNAKQGAIEVPPRYPFSINSYIPDRHL